MWNNGFVLGIALNVAVGAVKKTLELPLHIWCLGSRAGSRGEKLDMKEPEQRQTGTYRDRREPMKANGPLGD